MNTYVLEGRQIDSVELKCLLVSRGVKVDTAVYKALEDSCRLSMNPLCCNCLILSDGTICQLTDLGFHLKLLSGMLSWETLKLLRYASDLDTPFSVRLGGEGRTATEQESATTGSRNMTAGLFYQGELLDTLSFPPVSDFYRRKTGRGLPFVGNAVIQGLDWVAFQCLWPCEYAAAGKPCEFCFSGADFEARAKKGKPQPAPVDAQDVAEVVAYAVREPGVRHLQITGGSTFEGVSEHRFVRSYLEALTASGLPGETLLYITPPADFALLDEYMALGATRIACSLEVWDERLAAGITAGKMAYTTRERHIGALEYVARTYGAARAFSNFIIGLEPLESLERGARFLAERGILPSASVWMPMGRPVQGSMKAPDIEYYRRVKELFAELYATYELEPTDSRGLNVCIERDIWTWAKG
jgi:hypothetical protein